MKNQQPPERVGPNQIASGTVPIEKSRKITVSMSSVWGCLGKCLLVVGLAGQLEPPDNFF
jgi:hypothetical protein